MFLMSATSSGGTTVEEREGCVSTTGTVFMAGIAGKLGFSRRNKLR